MGIGDLAQRRLACKKVILVISIAACTMFFIACHPYVSLPIVSYHMNII